MKLQVNNGQVKQIALEVGKSFSIVRNNIIENKSKKCSFQGGNIGSMVSASFSDKIRFMLLSLSNVEYNNAFDWQTVGVIESLENQEYFLKVKNAVANLLTQHKTR